MNRKMIFLFAAITAAAPINSAPAADMEFGTVVNATCAIVVTQDGILAARQNARILTSGGRGARLRGQGAARGNRAAQQARLDDLPGGLKGAALNSNIQIWGPVAQLVRAADS